MDHKGTDESHELAAAYRARLERLVVKVLGRRLSSGEGLWRVELALLRLQREIQASITNLKGGRPTPTRREEIEALRDARWHARRFGDALAWVLFNDERRYIYPLSENERAPILPDTDGSRGLVVAAEALSEQLGFPLLHDVTDVLRVGDVTFFRPGELPRTAEVKTNVVGKVREGKNVKTEYRVTTMWPADRPQSDQRRTSQERQAKPNPRVFRQLDRMTAAHLVKTAEMGKPADIAGKKTLMIEGHLDGSPGHWTLLQRLIRRARRTGYASGVADGAIVYAVFYNSNGFASTGDLPLDRVRDDMLASKIFFDDRRKNSLWIAGLVDPRRPRGPLRFRPYFLHDIPRTSVLDLMHGRLIILSILNVGRVAAALEAAGLKVEMPGRRASAMSVLTEIEVDGARYLVELANLHEGMTEMVMEARSLSYVVGMAEAMAGGVNAQVPDLLRERNADNV